MFRAISVLLLGLSAAYAQTARPVIRYANVLGGSALDSATAITTDFAGNVYITGTTASADFPNAKRLAPRPASPDYQYQDLFVAKIDPSGANILYSVLLGPGTPSAIVAGADSSVYVAGAGANADLPTTPGAASTTGNCFLFKLDPSGSTLVYSTKLGGTGTIPQRGLTVDTDGNAFVAGRGTGMPRTVEGPNAEGSWPFAMKINAQGSTIVYATYLPQVQIYAITTDAQGHAYLTGSAWGKSFKPTVDTLTRERSEDGGVATGDVLLLKLSPDGTQILLSTMFGGLGDDHGSAVGVDGEGFIYISGSAQTSTGNLAQPVFPSTEEAYDRLPGFPRGFLAKLAPAGDALVFSTFLPDSDDGLCLNIGSAGIDVLTTQNRRDATPQLITTGLLRMSPGGGSLLSKTIGGVGYGPLCGHSGERFAFTVQEYSPASPDLSPLGPGGTGDVWFAAMDADVPDAPKLELNAGAMELRAHQAVDGSTPPVTVNLHAETGSKTLPIRVTPHLSFKDVETVPAQGTTPFDTALAIQQSGWTNRLYVFAPGAQDGLALLPSRIIQRPIQVVFEPESYHNGPGVVQLAVDRPDAPPVTGTIRISSMAEGDIFATLVTAPMEFKVTPTTDMPAWLTMNTTTGTTPTEITFTANGAGLSPGTRTVTFELRWSSYSPYAPAQATFTVNFRVGEAAAQIPRLFTTPQAVTIPVSDAQPAGSALLRVESTGDPLSFTMDPLPDWLTITPATGITPVDLTVTATPAAVENRSYTVRFQASNQQVRTVTVYTMVAPQDYDKRLSISTLSRQQIFADASRSGVASGALFFAKLDTYMPGPLAAEDAEPGGLPSSMAGYSFQLAGAPVPIRSYKDRTFLLQLPSGIQPGSYTLEALDANGARAGSVVMSVAAANPQYLEALVNGLYARKEDGSLINPENPVHPGERMLIRLTGQGAVSPALPDGQAASLEVPSTPVLPVTAYTGMKELRVVSATMSTTDAGVLDVWVEVPGLYDGDHYVTVKVGPLTAGVLPVKVAAQ
ncbi:SBBP repeat-containing protein [Paludibaculum fermentans]|uniref:SBBP repeat-containing protein n=1 Tax=Paludibaculum fermentans TaxID=1473598 RepID=A0A7S7NQW9_PALFE|nr:SBBP repeat-containing protein [Paludibaculum fermentans]QOY88157.1 SBBP repeat-containing protein [Paludibaculum fermentans]